MVENDFENESTDEGVNTNSQNEIVGNIVGVTNPSEFYFAITPGKVQLQELVAIDAYKIGDTGEIKDETNRVWAKVTEIERINPLFPQEAAQELAYQRMSAFDTVISLSREMITAKCRVLGVQNKEGELEPLTYPLQPASSVYIPPKEDVESLIVGQVPDYKRLQLGHLRSKEQFKVQLDGHAIVARHLAVLATTGAGKTVAVRKVLEALIEKNYPVLIYDPHSDYIGLKDVYQNKVEIYYPMLYLSEERDSEVIQYIAGLSGEILSPAQENLVRGLLAIYSNGQSFIDQHIRPNADRDYNLNLDTHHFYALLELLTTLQKISESDEWRNSILPEINQISRAIGQNLGSSGGAVGRMLYRAADTYKAMKNANLFGRTGQQKLPKPMEVVQLIVPGKVSIINLEGYTDEIRQSIIASLLKKLLDLRVEAKIRSFLTVVEEAHTIIPREAEGRVIPSTYILKQIATEGRKYGIGLILVSQRPNRVDDTVLSQCNSFFIMKLVNPNDQRYVRDVVESIGEQDAKILPDLATGEGLITGECVKFPMLVKVELPLSRGKHEEEDFIKEFIEESTAQSIKNPSEKIPPQETLL